MLKSNNSLPINILSDKEIPETFKLLRYFTVISLISIVIASLLLGFWMRQIAVDSLTQNEEQNNVALTRVLSNFVWPRYKDFITTAHQYSAEQLRAHPKTQKLNAFINNQTEGLSIIKIKIYDLNGLTVFSSDVKQIGASKKNHPSFIRAVNGRVVSKLSYRDKIYAKTEFISDRNIISSYIPIQPNNSQLIEGVFEVYKDVTPTLTKSHSTQTMVVLSIIGTLSTLFFILYFVIRHADQIIIKQNTKQHAEKEAIRNVAIYDTLTGLPNRILFVERLRRALLFSQRNDKLVALMFIDLDRFKQVNDNLGHDIGDKLLCNAAERLILCIREGDTVARISGDEFTVILENIESVESLTEVAERIIRSIAKPYHIESHEAFVTCSVGVSVFPFTDDSAESLMKKSDAAMYFSKSAGRNNFNFYTPEMQSQGSTQYQLEKDLYRALDNNEFRVYFQPKINISNWKMQSMEALIRWEHSEYGLVMPNDFIPILEDTGKIIAVGEWILRESCRITKKYHDEGLPPLRVAVNISALQIQQSNFYESVVSILKETGLDAKHLELELTESCLIDDVERNIVLLQQLKDYGITLSIDDFGTGYSSLSYLSKLPIDILKIDRSFINGMIKDKQKRSIVTAIINFARGLNMEIVAEGIEDFNQLTFLSAMQCTTAQGYLLSRPMPEEEFHALHKSDYNFSSILDNMKTN